LRDWRGVWKELENSSDLKIDHAGVEKL